MEKSIEERAYDYANKTSKHYPTPDSEVIFKSSYDNYVEIATEQRKIDIEKACDVYCNMRCNADTRQMCYLSPILRCIQFEVYKKALEE